MTTPTPEQLAKLPKWAQDHIKDLERERGAAVKALNDFTDADTPAAFYVEEHVGMGEKKGPSIKRRYIQTRAVICESQGIELRIFASGDLYGQSRPGIELSWSAISRGMSDVAFIPNARNSATLITKEHMR